MSVLDLISKPISTVGSSTPSPTKAPVLSAAPAIPTPASTTSFISSPISSVVDKAKLGTEPTPKRGFFLPPIADLKTSSGLDAESASILKSQKELDALRTAIDGPASAASFNTKVDAHNSRVKTFTQAVDDFNKSPKSEKMPEIGGIPTAAASTAPYAPNAKGLGDPFAILPGLNALGESVHEGSIKPTTDYLKQKFADLSGNKVDESGNLVEGTLKDKLLAAQNLTLALGIGGEGKTGAAENAAKIAKSADPVVISKLLKEELPRLSDSEIGSFAQVFKHINTPEDVTTAINRIKSQMTEAPKDFAKEPISEPAAKTPENISTELQPLAEEAGKYKTAEEFSAQQVRTQQRIKDNEGRIDSLKRQLDSTSRKDGDVRGEIQGEIDDLQTDNNKYKALGVEGKTKTDLVDFYNSTTKPSILKDLEPLAAEARKYKTAEEFVKARTKEPESYSPARQGVDTVYHQTSPESARTIVFSNVIKDGLNLASSPDLALGQKGKGALIEMASSGFNARKINKPGSNFVAGQDGKWPEFEAISGPSSLTKDVKSVTFDQPLSSKGELQFFGLRQNWKDTKEVLPDGKVKYTNPTYMDKKGLADFYNKAVGKDTTNMPAPGESPESKMAVAKAALAKTEKKLNVQSFKEPNKRAEIANQHIEQKKTELEIAKAALSEHPAKSLVKYANTDTGEIPEVVGGKNKGKFATRGDDIATEAGFKDSEQARRAYEDYRRQKRRIGDLDQQLRDLKQIEKDKKVQAADIEAARKFMDKGAKKTEKEIEAQAKKTIKEKLTQMEKRILERREEAHVNLRRLEKNLREVAPDFDSETLSLQSLVDQAANVEYADAPSLSKIMIDTSTSIKQKVGILDYLRTPDRVLTKIGLSKNAREIRTAYENYLSELPQHIDLLQEWHDRVLKHDGSDYKVFQYLDGKTKITDLNPEEQLVALEIKEYLKDWAYRLGLPEDDQISHYITHIFDKQVIEKEFDEDLAKIIREKVPGSVYDPFLEKRMGLKGYVQSTRRALEAYMKRAVRKVNMDPALENLKAATTAANGDPKIELSQYNYVKKYADRVNLRPTDIDNLVDNTIKQFIGYRLGQRPVAVITRALRQAVYRGMLGFNFTSAVKNLTQGVNTYAKLGEKYTIIGYTKLITMNGSNEIEEQGILGQDLHQDKSITVLRKTIQRFDKSLFIMFEAAERINRGAAYWGAKSKAIDEGMSEQAAIDYAKKMVRDTQFQFGNIDTPVAFQSDLAKTLSQFGNFTVKQTEMLTEMFKNYKKEWPGILRYIFAAFIITYSVGKVFNIKASTFIPNPLDLFSRFGTPPSLGLPIAITQALMPNQVDRFGKPMTAAQKLGSVESAAIPYIPAGVQAQKSYNGLQAYFGGKVEPGKMNAFHAATAGKSGLPKPSRADDILKKYGVDTKQNAASDILKKYGIK